MRIMHKTSLAGDPASAACTRQSDAALSGLTRPNRRGALLVEVIVGCVMLGVFLVAVVPMVTWVRTSRLTAESQQVAVNELANLMEHVAALPPADRTEEGLRQLTLSRSALAVLDDASLTVAIQPSEQLSDLQQVTLSLTWTDHAGQQVRPVRLSAWFADADKEPTQ